MKVKNKIYTIAFAVFMALGILITSCKKKDADPTPTPTPAPANGAVKFHFHTNVDTNEVDTYNTIYFMTGGRKISVSLAQLYVSNIQLVKSDGSTYDMTGVNILKLMEVEEYLIGNAPPGNYKSVRFNVGLAPTTDTSTPAANDSTLNHTNMWFNASTAAMGHVFMNFEGKIDTSTTANNAVAQMQPFTYKIGTNAHVKAISMPDQNYTVVSNQVQFIHIIIDYNKLFTGITLNNAANLNVTSVSDNAGSLANQIANNIPLMFSYEQ